MSEKLIAHFCAPALTGIKPSNIILCRMSEKAEIYAQLEKISPKKQAWSNKSCSKPVFTIIH